MGAGRAEHVLRGVRKGLRLGKAAGERIGAVFFLEGGGGGGAAFCFGVRQGVKLE